MQQDLVAARCRSRPAHLFFFPPIATTTTLLCITPTYYLWGILSARTRTRPSFSRNMMYYSAQEGAVVIQVLLQ